MRSILYHAILVSAVNKEDIHIAYRKARAIFGDLTSEIVESRRSALYSFFIAPDGFSEGSEWFQEEKARRQEFQEWLEAEDALFVDWAEVAYGPKIVVSKIQEERDKQ